MENTPRNSLHNDLLTLNFLNANENGTTAAERHWIMEKKTSELNQPVYFKDMQISQWKPGDVLCCGRSFALVFIGKEKLWIPPKLVKILFEKEKTLKKREMTAHLQW